MINNFTITGTHLPPGWRVSPYLPAGTFFAIPAEEWRIREYILSQLPKPVTLTEICAHLLASPDDVCEGVGFLVVCGTLRKGGTSLLGSQEYIWIGTNREELRKP